MLTRRQRDLLEFLVSYHDLQGVMPSYDEMADGLGGISKSSIFRMVSALEDRGFIKRLPYKARAIEFTAKARGELKSREDLQAEIERLRKELIRVMAVNRSLAEHAK
jgi:repressor LexA